MSILHALLLALACLPLAGSTQPGCDLEGCEEHALLQRDILAAKIIDGHSLVRGAEAKAPSPLSDESGTDDPPSATPGSDGALDELEQLQAKTKDATAKADSKDSSDVVGFGKKIADTLKCLTANSSTCSKPRLAEHVLGLLSSGLALADVLPEVGMLASLGTIALKFFFAGSGKKPSIPPLTVKQIGDVVKAQLLDFASKKEAEFNFPSFNSELHEKIQGFGGYVTSNIGIRDFTEFQSNLHSDTIQIQTIAQQVNSGWEVVLAWLHTNIAGQVTFATSCDTTCTTNGNAHWGPTCETDLNNVLQNVPKFKNAAAYLTSMSNAMALLATMAHGIYAKYNQSTHGPQLHGFTRAVLPMVKTGYKVAKNILSMAEDCSTLLTGWANASGTNMPSVRTTDAGHAHCSDLAWNGHGWYRIAKIGPVVVVDGFSQGQAGDINVFGFSHGNGGTPAPEGIAARVKWAREWWEDECVEFVHSLKLEAWNAADLCSNVWGQFHYENSWYHGFKTGGTDSEIDIGSFEYGRMATSKPDDHLHICARPLACAPNSNCHETFVRASYEWSE